MYALCLYQRKEEGKKWKVKEEERKEEEGLSVLENSSFSWRRKEEGRICRGRKAHLEEVSYAVPGREACLCLLQALFYVSYLLF